MHKTTRAHRRLLWILSCGAFAVSCAAVWAAYADDITSDGAASARVALFNRRIIEAPQVNPEQLRAWVPGEMEPHLLDSLGQRMQRQPPRMRSMLIPTEWTAAAVLIPTDTRANFILVAPRTER